MELDKTVIEKVKDFLGITNDLLPKDLYDILYDYRKKFHPDIYPHDYELQRAVEEKFKVINNLLEDLGKYLERENIIETPKEIAIYKEQNDLNLKYILDIVRKDKEIESLKSSISSNEYTIKDLQKELSILKDTRIEERTLELIKQFTPTKRSLISYGIIFIIALIGNILSRIDNVSNVIYKYWIFGDNSFNIIMLSILLIIPILYFFKLSQEKYANFISKRIITPYFVNKFLKYLENGTPKTDFNDFDVYNFLKMELMPKYKISYFFKTRILGLYNEIMLDNLKDIFIYNLLKKQYIYGSDIDKMTQYFKMKEKSRYGYTPF